MSESDAEVVGSGRARVPAEPPPPDRLLNRQFLVLAVAATVFFLGTGALNVLLPQYVVDELGGSEALAGLVMGSMAITALLTRVWFGRLADIRGARLILLIGALLAALSSLVLVTSTTVAVVILSRLLFGGAMGAFVTGATTLSIDLAPLEKRSQAASSILIAFHVGLGVGPLIAEALREVLSYDSVWLLTAGVALLAGVITRLLARPPMRAHTPGGPLIQRNAVPPGVVTLFGIVAFSGFLVFAPLYAREVGLAEVGVVFTVASITLAGMRLLFGWVPDRIGPIRAGSGALWITVVASLVIALWATPAGMLVGAVLLAGGLSLQSPSFMTVAVEGVPVNERGSALATYTGFFDIANALVGPTFGLIVVIAGYRAAFLTGSAAALAGLAVLHLVVAPRWRAGTSARTGGSASTGTPPHATRRATRTTATVPHPETG